MLSDDLIKTIEEKGVVGAGGAGFPTHKKLASGVDYLLINGAECEPLLRVDQNLVKANAKVLVETLGKVINSLNIKQGVFALKGKYTESIAALESAISGKKNISVHKLPDIYPSGDEVVLIYECTGRIIPEGQLPISKNVVVCNVETLYNIGNALNGNPVTHKYVTFAGEVKNRGSYRVPIGAKIGDVLDIAVPSVDDYVIIDGGPMTGKFVGKEDVITKTTNGIIVLPSIHKLVQRKQKPDLNSVRKVMSACSQCDQCTVLCPRHQLGHNVQPHKLMNAFANGIIEQAEVSKVALGCVGCNLCMLYSCHQELQPAELMMAVKGELNKNGIRPELKESKPDPYRKMRGVPSSRLVQRLGLKRYDLAAPIMEKPLEFDRVYIPLKQHIGAEAKPIVKIGEHVEVGQVIGKMEDGNLGSTIHASISGIVTNIENGKVVLERRSK